MKLIILFLAMLLFSTQVDFYSIDLVETSIVLEIEENNTIIEEFTSSEDNSILQNSDFTSESKIAKPYLIIFDPIHPDQELDPPDHLS